MSDEPEDDPRNDGLYILDEQRRTVPAKDYKEWAVWFEEHADQRLVKREHIGPFFISTVFLGIEMNVLSFLHKAPPLVFETMAFRMRDRDDDRETLAQERCSTWEQAEAQHERIASVYRAMKN